MIDYHRSLVAALNKVLPTHYELMLTKDTKTPCISYQERNNSVDVSGDTIGYSRLTYTIKVWSNDIEQLQNYALQIDSVLRPIGWKRTSCNELADINSTMMQKIMTYEALFREGF